MELKNPYETSSAPRMLQSFVCYADILGYSQLSKNSIRSGQGSQFLLRLRKALSTAYDRVRQFSEGANCNLFAFKVFTDNIVVGYPIRDYEIRFGEPELGRILSIFAEFQVGLAMEGFFLRGGIAVGDHYMDNDIVFGDALLEAIKEDKSGGPPRLSFAPSAVQVIKKHLCFYDRVERTPHYEDILEDADGTVFLNYLGEAFSAFPDGGVFFEVIEKHQLAVTEGLNQYRGDPGIRAKFEWAARYHNFICNEFVERHPVPGYSEPDEVYGLASEEAQGLLDYVIDVESLAAMPRRLSLSDQASGKNL
jgi:hypothetical protein